MYKCPECNGKKYIKYDGENGANSTFEDCAFCEGAGTVSNDVKIKAYYHTDKQALEILKKYPPNEYNIELIRKE